MRIDDAVLKCVCFIGYTVDGSQHLDGTGFLVALEGVRFVVTAQHVINHIRHIAPESPVTIWLNRHDGIRILSTDADSWLFHPTDPSVDAAVSSQPVPSEGYDHRAVSTSMFVGAPYLEKYDVGIGDELYFPGLFSEHRGRSRLMPILRQGTIAAMAEDPVDTRLGPMEAYLAEVRSIGGLSGSPVFIHQDMFRMSSGITDETIKEMSTQPARDALLGLVHGHFHRELPFSDPLDGELVNMGVSIIVPAQKVLEVIDQPEMVTARLVNQDEGEVGLAMDNTSIALAPPTP